jgi:hypothetical protein
MEVTLNKDYYSKNNYPKVIDTKFNQLGVKPIQEQLNSQVTVTDFFNSYNDLFYSIPQYGDINSHEFLIKKSSEYINFEADNEYITALQNEISQLRIDLLDEQKKNIDLTTKI